MKCLSIKSLLSVSVLGGALLFGGCSDDDSNGTTGNSVELTNRSVTPALLKAQGEFSSVEVFSLFSSDDTFEQSPSFIFGGSADGAGWVKTADGYVMLVNNEDNFSVSRITFDQTLKPVKGEYLLNSDDGQWRLCSATMATEAEHGFGPTFITCGESGPESRSHAVDPLGQPHSADRVLTALGAWSAENALPLPLSAYGDKTVIVIGDDDSGPYGGQVAMYVGNSVGDLDNGKLYVMKLSGAAMNETQLAVGSDYQVEFVQIPNQKNLAPEEFNVKSQELGAIQFGRVEDVDYRKGGGSNSRELYFVVTGQGHSGANADMSRTKYGRIYRLILDAGDPTKGTLRCILDGDDRSGMAKTFQNPDNICVTNNFVYIQEDPNGYGDETHDAYIYQYSIASNSMKVVFELDHQRNGTGDDTYGGRDSRFGSWEYGALVDISDIVGIPNTFSLCIQPHTWENDKYKNADGGSKRPNENQGSQVVILRGLPK